MRTKHDTSGGGASVDVCSHADERFRVLRTWISAVTLPQAVERFRGWIGNRERHYVNVCNAAVVLEAYDDHRLADIINRSGMATADGMPLVWLGRRKGCGVARVYGPDLMLAVCEAGLRDGWRHYFYGGTPDVLSDLSARLRGRFPALQIAGMWAPPYRPLLPDEEEQVARRINESRPDVVWVGLGTPKQDFWMSKFRPALHAPVLVAVGAAFNFHAGHVRQAPRWMMRCGLEWFFRLLMEPSRLWRRYLVGIPRFIGLILTDRGRKGDVGLREVSGAEAGDRQDGGWHG